MRWPPPRPTFPQGIPNACPQTRRTMWGIWVEEVTVIHPPSIWAVEVAVVVAENEVAAAQAARLVKVAYNEYPFVLDVQKAMEAGPARQSR